METKVPTEINLFKASYDESGVVDITTESTNGKTTTFNVNAINQGNTQITVSVPATSTYRAESITYNVCVNKIEVDVPDASEGLIYNGSVQTGVENKDPSIYNLTGNTATDAGNYTATATLKDKSRYIWKGKETSDDQSIYWSIAKADNPMTFPDQSDTSSYYDPDASVAYTFNAATGAPVDSSVVYQASSTASSPGNFYIPDDTKNILVCAEKTGEDTYTITLTAKTSETTNYKETEKTQTLIWNVITGIQAVQRSYSWYTDPEEPHGNTVNFLPAFNGSIDNTGIKMITKNGGDIYFDLNIGGSKAMSDVAASISSTGADKVYAFNAGDQSEKLYGVINWSWKDTFKEDTPKDETSKGLNDSFKNNLNSSGLKTLYFEDNNDQSDTALGYWDASDNVVPSNTMPKLGDDVKDVGYGYIKDGVSDGFYGAYSGLLSLKSKCAWSSRRWWDTDPSSPDFNGAYYWDAQHNSWGDRPYNHWQDPHGEVLYLTL